jgi:hypothetical protein
VHKAVPKSGLGKCPPELAGVQPTPQDELTLWRAGEVFMQYPRVRESRGNWRHEFSLVNLVARFGKDCPTKNIRNPQVKEYEVARLAQGAAPGTINRELTCLSKIISVLQELEHVDMNPAGMVRRLSEKSRQRHAHISHTVVPQLLLRAAAILRAVKVRHGFRIMSHSVIHVCASPGFTRKEGFHLSWFLCAV